MTTRWTAIATRIAAACWLVAAAACGGDSSAPNEGAAAAGASAPPAAKFSQIYAELFPRSSTGQCDMCHALPAHDVVNGALETGMTVASAYSALVGKASASSRCMSLPLVMPFHPEMSLFYLKLTATPPCGIRMPNGGRALSDAQLEMVRSWIAGGAMND
jgi:hypothetical protein